MAVWQKVLSRWKPRSHPKEFAILAGAMKCGTTTLHALLSRHPDICGAPEKEINYFTRDDYRWNLASYVSHWNAGDLAKARVALESSVSYTKGIANVPRRIADAERASGVRFRIIYVVRDPIEAIESFYRHAMTTLHWGRRLSLPDDTVDRHPMTIFDYASWIDELSARLGRKRVLVVQFEDVAAMARASSGTVDARGELALRLVCRHLDVSPLAGRAWPETPGGALRRVVGRTRAGPLWLHSSAERASSAEAALRERGLTSEQLLEWRLPPLAREFVAQRAATGLRRLRDEHGIDISGWVTAKGL